MSRDRIEQLLSRSIDGDLNPAEQAQLDAALEADPSLAQVRIAFSRVDEVLRSTLPQVDFNETRLCQSIMAGIDGPLAEPHQPLRVWWSRPALRYAAMVAIAATAAIAAWPSGKAAPATPIPTVEVLVNSTPIETLIQDDAPPVTEILVTAPPTVKPAAAEPIFAVPDINSEAPVVTLADDEGRAGSVR